MDHPASSSRLIAHYPFLLKAFLGNSPRNRDGYFTHFRSRHFWVIRLPWPLRMPVLSLRLHSASPYPFLLKAFLGNLPNRVLSGFGHFLACPIPVISGTFGNPGTCYPFLLKALLGNPLLGGEEGARPWIRST